MPLTLAWIAWVALGWQGGLHAWQQAGVAALLGVALWLGRDRLPAWRDLGPVERLAWLLVALAGWGVAYSLRPQVSFNAAAGLALGLLAATALRRTALPWAGPWATLVMAVGAAYAALFLAYGFGAAPWYHGTDLNGPVVMPHLASRFFAPNQNLLAGGLVVPAVLIAFARLSDPERARCAALGAWIALALGAGALISAGSRGSYLALAVGLAWLLLRSRGRRRALAWAAGALVVVLAVGALMAPFSRLAGRLKEQAGTVRVDPNYYRRSEFWAGAVILADQKPLLGHGLGTFAAAADGLDVPTALTDRAPIARYNLALEHAHNEWLELAVDMGWPAAVAMAVCALAWLWRRWRSRRQDPAELGLEAALLAAGAMTLVDMNLRTPGLAWGLLLSFAAVEPAPAPREPSRPALWFAEAVALVAVLSLVGAALKGEALALRRQHAPNAGELRVASCLQPLDAELAAWGREQGQGVWPWSDWAGRADPAWWWEQAVDATRSGDAALQERDARTAVELRPYYAPGWYWLGLKLADLGRPAEAALAMRKAADLEPNFSRALAWQADAAANAGDLKQAEALLRRIKAIQNLRGEDPHPDEYTVYIQKVDPSWLALHP